MLEVKSISSKEFGKLYSNYISSCIAGKPNSNPFNENLFLVKGNDVVDIYGNVIGKVVE